MAETRCFHSAIPALPNDSFAPTQFNSCSMRVSITLLILFLAFYGSLSAQAVSSSFTASPLEPFTLQAGKSSSVKPPVKWVDSPVPTDELDLLLRTMQVRDSMRLIDQSLPSAKASETAIGIDPPIGINFRGNQTIAGTPPDNSIAISNGGIIVSADNNSLDIFSDIGDSLRRVRLDTLLKDLSFSFLRFDPKVEYDFLTDRFYLTLATGNLASLSNVALLISKTNDPRDGWWEYPIPAIDPMLQGAWIDRPTIGHNNRDLFVTMTTVDDSTGLPIGNMMFQIEIASVLNGGPMNYLRWHDILNGSGNIDFHLEPASLGQVGTYGPDFYMVSTEGDSGEFVHLYHLDSVGINAYAIATSYYQFPAIASQLGSTDVLSVKDCKVMSAFYLNRKVHFVFHFDIGFAYAGISYNKISVDSLTNTRDTWGLVNTFYYAYPAIASYGVDSTDESVMIAFLRSGETIYPQACVVNYDNGWSPNTKIVKNGLGFVDAQATIFERWGDYSGICKRFNSINPGVWMAGQYGAGHSVNQYGSQDAWNTWIAEIGDGRSIAVPETEGTKPHSLVLWPNPTSGMLNVQIDGGIRSMVELEILDIFGSKHGSYKCLGNPAGITHLTIPLDELKLSQGIYFIGSTSNGIGYEKFVVEY